MRSSDDHLAFIAPRNLFNLEDSSRILKLTLNSWEKKSFKNTQKVYF